MPLSRNNCGKDDLYSTSTKISGGEYKSRDVEPFQFGEAVSKASLRKEGEGRIQAELGGY